MRERRTRPILAAVWLIAVVGGGTAAVSAQSLDEILGVRSATTEAGRKSQTKIDDITDQTRDLLSQFKQVMKIVDGLRIYNKQQRKLIGKQGEEIGDLNQSIDNVSLIERQIGPLIQRMIDNLEVFVALDVPFLKKEREERIEFLKDMMDQPDVAVSEKFSQVLGAYQIENSYGSTIEAYSDVIEIDGKSRQVDMLKFGRVSLVFQTPDTEFTGVWDNSADVRSWVALGDEYRAEVRDALRMARKTKTPDLVRLPVSAPVESSR